MSNNYSIEFVNGITRIQFFNKPSYSETQAVIDDIAENFPYEKRLWDLSNIKFNFTMNEIKAISSYGKSKFLKPNKLAIIAPDDLAYAEMRVFEVYREQEEHAVARAFRAEKEAIEWLKQ